MNIAPANTEPPDLLSAALDYASRGWSVIPLRAGDKRPALKEWKEFQTRRATENEIRSWWRQWPNANLGIVTGAVSGLIVLDIDGADGYRSLTTLGGADSFVTPVVTTGKGAHAYFSHPGGIVRNFARKLPGLDLRGDGGYVVAPPSIHPSGAQYVFYPGSGPDIAAAEPPPSLLELIQSGTTGEGVSTLNFSKVAPQQDRLAHPDRYVASAIEREVGRVTAAEEGARNDVLNQAAFSLGQLVASGIADRGLIERRLLTAATRSGLGDAEARSTLESGMRAGMTQPRTVPPAVGQAAQRQDNIVTFTGPGADLSASPPAKTASKAPRIIDASKFRLDILTEGEPPPRQWVTRGGVPQAVPAVIYGPGGLGKSMAVMDLLLKVATRHKSGPIVEPMTFLGPVPAEAAGATIFITLEDDQNELHRRIMRLDPSNSRAGAPMYAFPGLDMPEFDPTLLRQENKVPALTDFANRGLEELIERISDQSGVPVRAIALDPIGDMLQGSENDADNIKPLMRRLREVAARHGCTILPIGHSAKVKGEDVAEAGMRGSGAWVANARAAFGLWRPEPSEAERMLRQLELEPTAKNIERVIYGKLAKHNYPASIIGVRRYLQDPESGLIVDVTDGLRAKARGDADVAAELLLEAIKEAAALEMPYQLEGGSSLYKRRADLPPPLCNWGEKKLINLGKSLLESGAIVRCKLSGRGSMSLLDVPGGGYSTGISTQIASGSLAEAKRAKRAALGGGT